MGSSVQVFALATTIMMMILGAGAVDEVNVSSEAVAQQRQKETCRLDLSDELFGGVEAACGKGKALERNRCCPVLAAWLYAAHARTALQPAPPAAAADLPLLPDNSQTCVNTLQASLKARGIDILRPNATCDTILCFCGIRLHQLTSLACPVSLNLTTSRRPSAAKPVAAAVRALETNCTHPSYRGCTTCLHTLEKLKGSPPKKGEKSERSSRMYRRDCELMGLTFLLAKNKTAYIPTVSAVLRAIMYNTDTHQSRCSPDQENMPLALDSVELYQPSSYTIVGSPGGFMTIFWTLLLLLVLSLGNL